MTAKVEDTVNSSTARSRQQHMLIHRMREPLMCSDLVSFGRLVLCSCSGTFGHLGYEVVMQGGELCDDAGLAL